MENEEKIKLDIRFDQEGLKFDRGTYTVSLTDEKYCCYSIEVIERKTNELIFARPLGKKIIDITKIGKRTFKDFRKLIELQNEDTNWFVCQLLSAAENLKESRKIKENKCDLTKEESSDALAVLFRPDLDDYVLKTLDKVIVGELNLKQTIFHGGLSTYTFNPFSLKIEGGSRGGKDATTGKTSDLFPQEDVESFTSGMSQRAIEWIAAGARDSNYIIKLDNKIWIFPDIDENTGNVLKVLLSEGKKERQVAIKEDGKIVSIKLVVEGKPACFFTTVIPNVGHQFENRLVKRSITETSHQTQLILDYKKRCHAGLARSRLRNDKQFDDDPDAIAISNAIRHLRDFGKKKVVVPFAQLVEYPTSFLRDRGDIDHLFAFVSTHAFLHQFRRAQINDLIVATLEDYYFAFDLVVPYLSASRAGMVGRSYEIWEYLKEKKMATSKDVAMAIEDISQARASQILKSFYELDLATREKLPLHKGYVYHYKDIEHHKLGINKEIKPLFTTKFFKEWFTTKFKNTQPSIEVYISADERKTIDLVELYFCITEDIKNNINICQQNNQLPSTSIQNQLLTSNLTTLNGNKHSQAKLEDPKKASFYDKPVSDKDEGGTNE